LTRKNTSTQEVKKMVAKTQTKQMPISAVTGRIVTPQYAKSHPKTTVVLTVPTGKPAKRS
jgi:hypothetical protein